MRPVRFPRLSTQGVVFGLEVPALVVLMSAVMVLVITVMRGGFLGLLGSSPIWLTLGAIAFIRIRGVPMITVMMRELTWIVRRAMGTTRYRARPEKEDEGMASKIKTPRGPVLSLPGAESRYELLESGGGAVVIYDSAENTMTVSAIVATDGHFGLSDAEREHFLNQWSRVQGVWTLRDGIARITITEQTSPSSAAAATAYYLEHASAGARVASELAASYQDVLASAGAVAVSHRTQIAMTFDLSKMARDVKHHGGGRTGVLGLASLEMAAAEDALWKAGFSKVRWQTAREWVAWGRQTLDPAYQSIIDQRTTMGSELVGVDPAAGAPMAIDEYRDKVVVDSGYHRTIWVHQFPRLEVFPGFLEHVVFSWLPDGEPLRHTMQLVLNPVAVNKALRRIDDAKKTWMSNADLRAKAGKLESAADRADWQNLVDQEEAIVSGHGEYKYSAYVTVHAESLEALEIASATMRNALGRAGLEPQVLYCQQAAALMMAAFPAGLGMR